MNFSISDSIGFIGGWILFGALAIACFVAFALIVRAVRGPDDTPLPPAEHTREDDDVI